MMLVRNSMSSIVDPYVVLNLYNFCSSTEHNIRNKMFLLRVVGNMHKIEIF